jgi:hypothetical protein
MKILIDILHPAHVHFFRNFIKLMEKKGSQVLITARQKECVKELLDQYQFDYQIISQQKKGLMSLGLEMFFRSFHLYRIAKKFQPDFMLGIMGPSIAVVSKFLKSKSIVFYDTEMAEITNRFVYPLTDIICTPTCYQGKVKGNHIKYPGYQELAYLHPTRFTPDRTILEKIGIKEKERFFIVRFVSFSASHDLKEVGISLANKYKLVELLEKYGRVFISSEEKLPPDLQKNLFSLKACELHHLMAFADLLVSESATMCSESAILGVESVYIARTSRGYIEEEATRYSLIHIFNHQQQDGALKKVEELVTDPELKKKAQLKRQKLLQDKIDVTGWMIDFIEKEYKRRKR